MKLFDVDWARVVSDLPRWETLSLGARRALLDELKMSGYTGTLRFGGALDPIVASGIVIHEPQRKRVWLNERHRELVKVLRAMGRNCLFDDVSSSAITQYLSEHFTEPECVALAATLSGAMAFPHASRHLLAQQVTREDWPKALLDCDTDAALLAWGAKYLRETPSGDTLAVARALHAVVHALLKARQPVLLRDFVKNADQAQRAAFGETLYAGLNSLVLFAALRVKDLEPMIGLWPEAVRELTRETSPPPEVVVPMEQYAVASRMEDMSIVMSAVIAAPIRLRAGDLAVFARVRADIEKRLVAPPPWAIASFTDPGFNRVDEAGRRLSLYGYAKTFPHHATPHLHATEAGVRWLALSAHDRLAALIDPIRTSKDINPRGSMGTAAADSFFPFYFPYYSAPKLLNLRSAVIRTFRRAANGFVALGPFLEHAANEDNPLLGLTGAAAQETLGWLNYGQGDVRSSARRLWNNALVSFLDGHLIGLGGATIGRLANGALCFQLTDVGLYLLGEAASFTYGESGATDIVIQPNFDIVFLGASPHLEAICARFAERVGVAPGLAFRITRASVLSAAEGGATTEQVLAALQKASSKPIPKNVQREITTWMASVRRAKLRAMEVIECADEATADRVVVVLGSKVRRLAPTLFELPASTSAARSATLKRLRTAGVFIEAIVVADPKVAIQRARRAARTWDDDEVEWDVPD